MANELNTVYYRLRMIPSRIIQRLRWWKFRAMGYDIDKTAQIERNVSFDRINAKGVHIGGDTIMVSGSRVLSHYLRAHVYVDKKGEKRTKYTGEVCDTYIGHSCVIGGGARILAGVRIGNYCVVGAGSIVTKDVPDNTIVAGNPARVLRENIDFNELRI
ncbi:MAG: acyltransferase [Bacteroidaceae bacterium]|nr:acyltransferase [Bacteroidaceae bacterium]